MTAHTHRSSRSIVDHAAHPLDHSPEVLLALAAVLIVVAGPVAHALLTPGPLMAAASALLLVVGVALAVAAATRMLRD
ncbi:hypothetical protein ACQBAT_06880 [Ornithinimicrobium sp. Y1847]|uniref:hypothetical protein n=1 Tax=unclassified Ornithinimicrobium TaxID=2615080 RepID=UPI003B67E7EB